jgi:hypothetical protein
MTTECIPCKIGAPHKRLNPKTGRMVTISKEEAHKAK